MFELFRTGRRTMEREAPSDRRSARRGRVLLSGKIVYGPGYTADCAIRALSNGGAQVLLPPNQKAPSEFYLIVVRHGVAHRARTAWSAPRKAGVSFEASHDFAGPTP